MENIGMTILPKGKFSLEQIRELNNQIEELADFFDEGSIEDIKKLVEEQNEKGEDMNLLFRKLRQKAFERISRGETKFKVPTFDEKTEEWAAIRYNDNDLIEFLKFIKDPESNPELKEHHYKD